MAAARRWAEGGGECEVWPENWDAITAWRVVADQWRIGPAGHPLGLDWPAVEVLLRAAGIALDAALLGRLRVIESSVLEVFAADSTRRG